MGSSESLRLRPLAEKRCMLHTVCNIALNVFLADKPNTCSRSLCECDKKLAEDLSKLEDTAAMDFRKRFKILGQRWICKNDDISKVEIISR